MPEDELDATTTETESAAAPSAADLQQQIADLREQVAESNRTAQFWADKAKTSTAAAPAAPIGEEDEEEEEPDVLEAITTKGAKGFDQLASKRGFIRRDEVETLINAKATALTKEQALMDEYPDLKNRTSEFFKATAVNYGELVKQGTPAGVAMELAARQTELAFLRAGKGTPPAGGKEEKDARRQARIAAQSPGSSGGRRPAASASDEEESAELTPEQKHICDAMGVPYENYTKRAKAGVAMGGGRR